MRSWRTTVVLTLAAFPAGFSAMFLLPAPERHASAGRRATTASPPPSPVSVRHASLLARTAEARKRAVTLTVAEARGILEKLEPPVPEESLPWLTAVLRCWAEGEPEAALDWFRGWSKRGVPPFGWSEIVLIPLARKDPAAAIAAAQLLGIQWYGMGFGGLLAAAAERNPAGTMAFIEQHRQLAHEATKAFRVWLQRDAAAACAWLGSTKVRDSLRMRDLIADIAALAPAQLDAVMASMPEGSQGLENAKLALAALEVDRDPGAALAKFPSLPAEDRQRMMEPLALHLAARGTAAEITGFLGSLTADERSDFFGNLSESFSFAETERLLPLVRRPELTDTEKARLLSKASHLEPQHAEELMALLYHKDSPYSSSAAGFWTANLSRAPDETLPILSRMAADGRVDAALLRSITAQISRHDATGAALMIAALPVSLQAEPRALLAAQAALSGDSTAIADFSSLPTTEARQETLRAIFNDRQGEYDAVRRAAFVQQLPPEQRMEAISAMVITPADCPALLPVVDQAVRSGTGGSSLNSAVVTIAAQNPDPASAMQWLDTLPAGEARDSGRSGIFSSFALKDSVAASAWLAALPPETPRRDEMTSTLVSRITPSDPERAWQWAATIRDETQRQSVQQSVLERWHLLDPAAAAGAAGAAGP